jgi:hypothetical protein
MKGNVGEASSENAKMWVSGISGLPEKLVLVGREHIRNPRKAY